jgi:hypothetical protein
MKYSHNIPQPQQQPHQLASQSRILHVNFSWRKLRTLITDPSQDEPVYLVKCNPLTLNLTFKSGSQAAKAAAMPDSDSDPDSDNATEDGVVGDGSVHGFKIDCNTHVHGRPIRVSAAKKWKTRYTYPSLAFSSDPSNNKPAIMTWKSSSFFKCFDFVLLDESQQPVARFNVNYFGVRKLATIELLGPKADDPAARDEVVVTSLTLYICMVYRASSILAFFGAAVARPEKDYKVTDKQVMEEVMKVGDADEYSSSDGRLEDG